MINALKSDCQNCFGLCCVALPYGESADFPFDKESGMPCRNLCSDNACSIHDKLRKTGFRGCVSYECFGAGQHVSQTIYKGRTGGGASMQKKCSLSFRLFNNYMKCSGI